MEDDELFQELANDTDIAAAAAEHAAACSQEQETGCIICSFFMNIHELRHMSEVFDAEKLAGVATPDFFSDSMAIIQFLSATAKTFLDSEVSWEEEEEEDD